MIIKKLIALGTDTIIYGIFTIVGRFLSFLLYPLYTNFVPKNEIGEIANIFSIIAFINIIYTFGMESAFFRFYKENDPKIVYTHSFLTIAIVSGFLSSILLFNSSNLSFLLTGQTINVETITLACLVPFFDSLLIIPYAQLRMERKAFHFALTRFIIVLTAVLLNVLFVAYFNYGTYGIFLAQLISSVLGLIILSPNLLNNIRFKLDQNLFKSMLRFGIPTIPASLSAIALQVADKPIMRAIAGAEQLGLYAVNYKLGIIMMLLVSVFEYAWKPFYLSNYKDKDANELFARILTYFTIISAILFLTISIFINYIVQIPFIGGKLINPAYWQGLGIVPIILAGYYFNGVFNNFAAGIHIAKKTKYLPIAVGIAGLVNIALNFLLIPIFGIWGAAWATFFAYLISALIIYYFSNKYYPIKYEFKRLGIVICSVILIYFIDQQLINLFPENYIIFMKIALIIFFFFLLLILKFFDNKELNYLRKIFGLEKNFEKTQ